MNYEKYLFGKECKCIKSFMRIPVFSVLVYVGTWKKARKKVPRNRVPENKIHDKINPRKNVVC